MKDSKRKDVIITCPYCGREYLFSEIYVKNAFFGNPEYIERNSSGKIEDFEGTPMDFKEEYCCDSCENTFKVEASLKVKASKKEQELFNPVYISSLYPPKVSLFEPEDAQI